MTITAAALAGGAQGDNVTSVSRSVGSVTAGQMVSVSSPRYSGSADAFVAGDCTKTAGTSTIGTVSLDNGGGGNTGVSDYAYVGIWSALVTGSGTLTMQVGGAPAGSYLLIACEAFNGNWDSSRVEQAPTPVLDTSNTISTISAGSGTSAGAALFVACMALNDDKANTITQDGSATVIYESEVVTSSLGSSTYRIVSSGTTYNPSWTFTAATGGAGSGAAACQVVYKEAAGGSSSILPQMMQHHEG